MSEYPSSPDFCHAKIFAIASFVTSRRLGRGGLAPGERWGVEVQLAVPACCGREECPAAFRPGDVPLTQEFAIEAYPAF